MNGSLQDSVRLRQDKEAIDEVTGLFFGVFTNSAGRQPDWSVPGDICIAEVLIIRKSGGVETVYNLESFIEPRRRILADGTLTEFEEREVEEETRISGNLAQRLSRYRKYGYLNGAYFQEYGIKSFQLMRRGEDWKIYCVVWEDEH